ncbi:MAG: iron ABC transporter permease [Stomatobaculum sp.]|nr:iron ABC transporter permease [Stomatobaculum sp.]
MRAERRWAFDVKWIFILLILDFMLVFQLLPLIFILWRAVFPEGTFSLDTLRRLVTYPMNREALKNTLIAAFASMVFGTAFAFPLAWLVGRTDLYGRKLFRWLFVLSYMVPPYVGAMAWLRLMNPNVGTINQWLRMLFRLGDGPGPLNVYTLPGIIWVLTTFYYPYAFITVSRAMEKMDPSLEEAARVSGASPFRTVLTVTLPLMTPSLIAGALLVFISAASCYGIPSIIGTPGNVSTVTTRIVEYVALGQQGMNDATALSVFLMGTAVLILFISEVVLAKKQYITVSGKSVRPAIVELRAFRIPLTILVALFAGLVIFLPFFTILTTSFKVDIGKNIFAPGNFTLVNWTTVFNRGETMSCLKNSFLFASAAATVGLLIAVLMSWLLQRTRVRGRGIPAFLITLGSGTPSVVIALGLIMTMRGNFGINIYGTAYIMIIAYMIKYMLMGMRTVVSALSQIHQSLEESSLASGAGWLYTMRKINVPLILPSVAASWFLIFIPSFYELSMTTLLYSTTTKTIGFQLYEYWTFTSQPMSCAMAFGILMIVVALNFLLGKITGGALSISG